MKIIQNFRFIFITTCIVLLYTACGDDFFDNNPYTGIPEEQVISSIQDMEAALNGAYAGLRSPNLYDMAIPFINEVMADQIYRIPNAIANSGRYASMFNYNVVAADIDIGLIWRDAYNNILRTNTLINATLERSEVVDQLRGEAYTIRALLYFELIRMYALPYTVNPDAPGVPLILEYNIDEKPSRSSVNAIYDQIINDLDTAYDLMTQDNKNSSYINKSMAKALQSKVYLYRGAYTQALEAGEIVINSGGYSLVSNEAYIDYWRDPNPRFDKVETLFEVADNPNNNFTFSGLASIYDQSLTFSGGDALCSDALFNIYADSDIRKSFITPAIRADIPVLAAQKYMGVDPENWYDVKVLRYADVLLIVAESAYQTGDEATALDLLNEVAIARQPDLAPYNDVGEALLDRIIEERRKEFAFEGDRFPDLNRLQRPIVRDAQFAPGTEIISVGDSRRVAPLPQREYDANPNLRPQNDGY